jgi:hypothetical protein
MKIFLILIGATMTFVSPCLSRTLFTDPLTIPVLIVHEKGFFDVFNG